MLGNILLIFFNVDKLTGFYMKGIMVLERIHDNPSGKNYLKSVIKHCTRKLKLFKR